MTRKMGQLRLRCGSPTLCLGRVEAASSLTSPHWIGGWRLWTRWGVLGASQRLYRVPPW